MWCTHAEYLLNTLTVALTRQSNVVSTSIGEVYFERIGLIITLLPPYTCHTAQISQLAE